MKRQPACAGTWYPDDAPTLTRFVDKCLRVEGVADDARPVALIAPHAGYRFSAPIAAKAYARLPHNGYKRVIVLAFSHREAHTYRGIDVAASLESYATPLGEVPLDHSCCKALLQDPLFNEHRGLGDDEHSLELQLPLLQRSVQNFELVPLLVGRMNDKEITRAARTLLPHCDDSTLLIVSTDFTHYGARFGYRPFSEDVSSGLKMLADSAARPLQDCDYDGFVEHLTTTSDTICGRDALRLLLRILSMRGGAKGIRTSFDTSGRQIGDYSSSVTYQSFVFVPPTQRFDDTDHAAMFRLARQSLENHLAGLAPFEPPPNSLPRRLQTDGACFVTLRNGETLRGCIGQMRATEPLYRSIIHNAKLACEDPRFITRPILLAELPDLSIEISCISPLKRIESPEQLIIGRHGLLIVKGSQRGVLLPQVAYEQGWLREEFLQHTARKAGLPEHAWRDPEAELYVFEAEVVGEE